MDGEATNLPREQGIRGTLYYRGLSQPRFYNVADYFNSGTRVQATDTGTGYLTDLVLFFNQIYIPTRPFDRGFITQGGQEILTDNGDSLYEYFAVRHEGRLQLAANQVPGLYQLAILSDDGAVMNMDFGSGSQEIINNDGDHPTRMGCAVAPVEFKAGDKIPYVLDYYQGPRYHISLVLMMRPWPMSSADPTQPASVEEARDAFCGVQGNSFYFNSAANPPEPTANYAAMLTRGWAPLAPENYLLPETDAVNPCNEPAPVISALRVTSITNNSITLAWDTDRAATSQIFYRRSVDTVEDATTPDGVMRTQHSVTVTGLTSNTDYVVRGSSASGSGLTTDSINLTIRTRR
jgi:hypothetical protein